MDPHVVTYPDAAEIRPTRFGRFVPVAEHPRERTLVAATPQAETLPSLPARLAEAAQRIVLGPPLSATAIAKERMRKIVALPVLSADALSSVAYGPEAMLAALVVAGSAGLGYSLPIAGAIAFLMLAVGVSYRQTIRAYPHGGGSYVVATDNLGRVPGLVAAAGLMTDYILTVAVSVASGVAAITSAIPSLAPDAVAIGVGVIALLLAGNLRGVRQAGALFAAPTYAFIVALFALVAVGLADAAGRGFHPTPTPHLAATEGVSLLLVLRAFSSGSTAMTGIEAVSNAVPAFKPVEWRNARTTLTWMVSLLIAMFAGTIALVHLDGVVPSASETVLSEIAHRSFGSGAMYAFTQASTAAILLLAANTSYNDFPRVLFLLARSFHAPRLFLRIGDRLAFSNGIIVLSLVACVIYVAFGGETAPLIPLFAVGVFLAFTMSQAGMVVHWWRHRDDAHWRRSLAFNFTGGFLSAIVFITAGTTKFTSGAWVSVLAVLLFVSLALGIRRHYDLVGEAVALHPHAIEVPRRTVSPRPAPPALPEDGRAMQAPAPAARSGASERHTDGHNAAHDADELQTETEESPQQIHNLAVVPVAALDLPAMRALAYAASLQQPVLALHISPTEGEAERFRGYWRTWGDHLPLEVVVSPHRAIVAPMVNYIDTLHEQRPDLTITVILPEIVVRHWWERILHNNTAPRVRRALRPLPRIVVTTVPFHLPARHPAARDR
ncbi:MAG TPA: APC family permease [Solirubrobacteraceae bacterium]|nr:APC family permease [Solirubrobacteraceae bacterium]